MPYTKKQQKLFNAAAHNKAFAKKVGIKQSDAKALAEEANRLPTRKPVKKKGK